MGTDIRTYPLTKLRIVGWGRNIPIFLICQFDFTPNSLIILPKKFLFLLKKKRGKAKVKAHAVVALSNGKQAKIVFAPCDKKRGWLAFLSTDLSLPNDGIIRLYSKRWDIEFFSKCANNT